jgi:hypothetical protein
VKIYENKLLNFDLVNASCELPSFTIAIECIRDQSTDTFVRVIHGMLEDLRSKGILITSIVMDGLRAQVHPLNYDADGSIQREIGGEFRSLIHVPCMAHRLNLIVKYVYRENECFKLIIDLSRELAVYLRKKKYRGESNSICPLYVETGWCYDTDVIKYILQYKESILSLLHVMYDRPPEYPMNLELICNLMIDMKEIILDLEKTSKLISSVYPIIEKFYTKL